MIRIWQCVPAPLRRQFWLGAHACRRAALPWWLLLRWRRGASPRPLDAGLVVAGLFRDTRGVAQAARLFADALEGAGASVMRVDAGPALGIPAVLQPLSTVLSMPPDAGTLVTCLNPPELLRWLDATGGRYIRGLRHVGYWAWELPDAPPAWRDAFRYVDEVWCHSEFAAAAVRKLAPRGTPVRALALPVFMTAPAVPDRTRFGLSDSTCVVLTAMDLRSTAARKNPAGALAAYLAAVPEPTGETLLLCKVSGEFGGASQVRQTLEAAAAQRGDVRLIEAQLSEAEMSSLVASADIVLSLHRAEGFGLLTAEATWLGRPVVTTDWSAPVEFLDSQAAALISWMPTPVEDPQGLYGGDIPGATWAEPSVADAAIQLRELILSQSRRREMGERAALYARRVFDPVAWERRVRNYLSGAETQA